MLENKKSELSPIFLFNTLSRKKEQFKSIDKNQVKLYTCGPTVYHTAHIGNLRTYIFEDLLVRTLSYAGYEVNHVMNITDVGHLTSDGDEGEDRMEKGSLREQKSAWDIALQYTDIFFSDLDKLNCIRPKNVPRATDHINEMIDLIQKLEKAGYTYETSDGVYFDTSRYPMYADFAQLDVENLEAGIRVEIREKRHATDFALWKFSLANQMRQMEWDSPWGRGFPGWHIECSAMSMKYLGETLDIHCGGKDHIPVHHTNEIAQSQAATGKIFSRFWMHGEFLIDDSGKMSKSKGDFLTLKRVEDEGFRPVVYRFWLLQAHYRNEVHFDWKDLKAAQVGFERILNRMSEWEDLGITAHNAELGIDAKAYLTRFEDALFDDLNSPIGLQILFDMLKAKSLCNSEKLALIYRFDQILGLNFKAELKRRNISDEISNEIRELVYQRNQARIRKAWKESDRLRDELISRGYRVDDTPKGTRVTKV